MSPIRNPIMRIANGTLRQRLETCHQMKKTKSKAKLRMTMVIGIGGKLHHSNYMENIWGTGLKFGLSVEDMQEAASWI